MDILQRKPYQDLIRHTQDKKLNRVLGAFDITIMGLGIIIGTGIFVLTGIGAAKYAGPGLMVSFILAAVTCAFVCLTYSELATFLPVSGSSYTYAYASLGEYFGWWVGWSLILEYSVGASAVAGGWSAYFVGILHSCGIELPKALTAVPADGGIINLPAFAIVLLATLCLILGVREGARVNRALVVVKIVTIFAFLFFAGPHIDPLNWQSFLPYGWDGVVAGTAVLFFAYLGFDALSTAAEETKNPTHDIPVGIISALAICTVLYIAVCAAMTGVVPYEQLDTAAPASYVLEYIGMRAGSALIGTGALCGLSTVVLNMLFAQSRALYSMSRDGLIPNSLYKVHEKYRTPYRIQIIIGIIVSLVAGFTPIHIVAEACSAGTIFAFLCSCVGIIVLRKIYPRIPRGFRCPAVYVIAPLGFIFCAFIFAHLSIHTLELFVGWSVVGTVIYAIYGYKHSTLRHGEPESHE